jgi:hypothetical protein
MAIHLTSLKTLIEDIMALLVIESRRIDRALFELMASKAPDIVMN